MKAFINASDEFWAKQKKIPTFFEIQSDVVDGRSMPNHLDLLY